MFAWDLDAGTQRKCTATKVSANQLLLAIRTSISCRKRTEADLQEGEVLEEDPDKWNNMLFYVKWRRWSYRHCTHESLQTLSQLGGFKRVLNYCKRMEEQEV